MIRRNRLSLVFFIAVSFAAAAAADVPSAVSPPEAMGDSFEKVEFDSLEREGFFSSKPVRLAGFLLKGASDGGRVAVLAHPCEGLLREDGGIWPKYRKMAKILNETGVSVLLVDSFTPRSKRNICSESPKTRTITADTRKKDNLGALAYLRTRQDTRNGKALLVGWGSASVLETVSGHADAPGFDAAVAWYPPCSAGAGIKPTAPVLVLVGEKDDWNPAVACQTLASRLPSSPSLEVAVFPDTYHSFDTPNRPQRSVRWAGGVSTVGSNPQSTQEAYRRILEFISQHLPVATAATNLHGVF